MELRRGTMTLPASEDKAKRWDVREYTETPTAVPVSATGFWHVSDGALTSPIDIEQTVIGLMRSEGCGNLARLLFNSDPDIRALDLGDVSGESSNPYRVDAAARAWAMEHPLRAKYEEMVKRVVEELGKP